MHAVVALAAALAASGTPSTPPTAPDPDSVTPGLAGFLVVFVLAIVTWLLLRNMTGRLRRMRYREEERVARETGDTTPDEGSGPDHPTAH